MLEKELTMKIGEFRKSLLADIENNTEDDKDSATEKRSLALNYFKNTSAIGSIVILNKIQNDVLYAENSLLNYFNSMTISYTDSYQQFSAFAIQNSSYLKAGQMHEIYAGSWLFQFCSKT